MRHGSFAILACLLGLWLGGCGDTVDEPSQAAESSESTGTTEDPSEKPVPDGPACEEIWVDDQNLPRSYRGCVDDGAWVAADTRRCSSGQVLVSHADRYYGAKGAVVNDVGEPLEENRQYQRALRSCG